MGKIKTKKAKVSMSDKAFNIVLMVIATTVLLMILYPIIFIVSSSFSSMEAVFSGQVFLWPVDFTTAYYEWALSNRMVGIGFENSIVYTVGATLLHLFMTICAAYPLSRKNYQARGIIQKYFIASMLLGGGLIPLFLLIIELELYNNPLWIFISGIVAVNHIIILRTFFQSNIPYELYESARMDGISDYGYLIKILLPLSKAAIAVIGLYAAVETWNAYAIPYLYLRDRSYFPLQLVLNEMLAHVYYDAPSSGTVIVYPWDMTAVRCAVIVIGAAPTIILFPLVQKFFEKGVAMGAVKG